MSMLMPASASGRKTGAAMPGGRARRDRHLRLAGVVGDARDDGLLSTSSSLTIQVPSSLVERRADVDRHAVVASVLDRAQHQDARAVRRQVEHLLVRHLRELARLRDDPRVGAVDAVDVGVDLAHVRLERGRERDRGRVGAAAAERRDVARRSRRPGSRRRSRSARVERLVDAAAAHLDDARPAVARVGDDPRLRSGERDRLAAEVVDRHREERDRDPLARGEQHVELARVRVGRDERARARSARRSSCPSPRRPRRPCSRPRPSRRSGGDALDLLGVGDRGAAVLLDDCGHGPETYRRTGAFFQEPSILRQ